MKLFKITGFVITSLILGFVLHLYYVKKHGTTNIVEIHPDNSITKIKRSDVDHDKDQTLSYETIGKPINNKKVKLSQDPEEPINRELSNLEDFSNVFSKIENDGLENNTTLNVIHIDDDNDIKHYKKGTRGYKLQLASVKTYNEAVVAWEKIKKKHSKILENAKVNFKKVNHDNGKIFYLLLVGNYEKLHQAKAVCKKLILRQQSCIVEK